MLRTTWSAAAACGTAVVALLLTFGTATAVAGELCVAPATGCVGGQQPTLQLALNAALASNGPDTVRLPSGIVEGPGSYESANPENTVDVVGAGRDATVIVSKSAGEILSIRRAGVVSDLTVRQPNPAIPGQEMAEINGHIERVGFTSTSGLSSVELAGTAKQIQSVGPAYLLIRGTLEESEISGGGLATGTGDTVVRRVRVEAPSPVFGQNHSLVVSSSLFIATQPNSAIAGFLPSPVENSQASVLLANVTFIGAGGPGCVGITSSGDNIYAPPKDFSTENLTVTNSIVRNCATTLLRESSGGDRTANLTVFNSDLDLSPTAVSQSGFGTLEDGPGDGNINSDPLFIGLPGAMQALPFNSPGIDTGLRKPLSQEESTTDLDGNPRSVDGNGDGTAVPDMGAFEYQRRAPLATAVADRATANVGETVTFTGSASESDPGESVTALTWQFDDGSSATGAVAQHAFSAPGDHMVTLTATSSAGATGSAVVKVHVPAALSGSTPAVRSISVSPTTFRAARRGASIATRGKVPTGTAVHLILTAPAAVKLIVQRVGSGRLRGHSCVAPTRKTRRAKVCVRYVALPGALARAAGAPSTFRFTGRLSGRALSPGRYRLLARVGATTPRAAAFRIVR